MKYPHIVVKNGVWYPAGVEVPENIPKRVELKDDVLVNTQGPEKQKRGRKPKEA